jgi:cytoskeletal protein CcmA (bactofilin family)
MFGREKPAPQQPQPQTPAPQPATRPEPAPPPAPKSSTPPASKPASAVQGQPKIETVIGPNCRLSGVLQSEGGVRVEGSFEGQIQTTGNLVVAESARVVAEIQAYNVVVSGQVKGNVTANRIEITETGKVFGDLNVNTLLLNEGAYLRGQTNMLGDVEPPLVETPRIAPVRPVDAPALDSASPATPDA